MRIRVLLIGALLLASACTGDQGREGQPSQHASTASPAETSEVTSETGWLAVNLRLRWEGAGYFEGEVSFVQVRDAFGEVVGGTRSIRTRTFFRQQLTPGVYDVRTFLRPCDGSCQVLDAPQDECRFRVEMLPDGSDRFVVVTEVVALSGECSVSDKGDSIDVN